MTASRQWSMPAEGAFHERTWMAWPSKGYTLGDSVEEADTARRAWAEVANAVAGFESVTMVVDPADVEVARRLLDGEIDLVEHPLDDAWMRDIGPTFVTAADGRLGAVDWVFNGWGKQRWAAWEHDAGVGSFVAELAGAELIESPLVNEGGAIHVDGEGTVLLTDTVQLDTDRNPGLGRAEVESELARTIGTTHCIWLPRGLSRDYDEFGTRGHVDIVATFPTPGTVLLHRQPDDSHPDHHVFGVLGDVLAEAGDAAGRRLEIIPLVAPNAVTDEHGPLDWSYVNHYVLNGGVIAGTFDDPNDDAALAVLAEHYPGRRIVGVDARPLFERGGGIHCITQQQPVTRRGDAASPSAESAR